MKLRVLKSNLKHFEASLEKASLTEASNAFSHRFQGDNKRAVCVTLDCDITLELLQSIQEIATEIDDGYAKVDVEVALFSFEHKDIEKVKSLKGFIKLFRKFIEQDMINGWLFKLNLGQDYLPFLVYDCHHTPARPDIQQQAHVTVSFSNSTSKDLKNSNKKDSVDFFMDDVYNKTVPEILASKMFFKETEKMITIHEKHIDDYDKFHDTLGAQYIAQKDCVIIDSYRSEISSNKGHRLVNDQHDTKFMDSIAQISCVPFFNKKKDDDEDDGELKGFGFYDRERVEMKLPFHPYIKMFDLETHQNLWTLASNITPYEYDTTVSDKLILPEDHRDLVDVLVNDADIVLDDIVSNKSGGTTILCKGEAGLGKTLTAEVYSETIEKPLYLVHSGQLGTNPEKIDEKLSVILERAKRWGAILLLDEADVYIRKRDNSMDHNAIVAAFLRQLERFDGIIFLTTNRSDDVDDAIVSRCTAVIDYEHPKGKELSQIWKVLGIQYKIDLNDELISELVNLFVKTSGRDVKELLKLASKYKSQRNIDIDIDVFRKCAMFRGLKTKESDSLNN
jgi:hypothetical protein